MTVKNPFATAAGAARYHAGRPFHHPRALARIIDALGHPRLERALDVACGTGLSTVALAERASIAVGIDPVEAMVRLAPRPSNVSYFLAAAEALPFDNEVFDLVTVSSGVHWFHQETFLSEAARVLVPQGGIALYDHFFTGSADDSAFNTWLHESYGTTYPPPARGPRADADIPLPEGIVEIDAFEYDDPIGFTQDELVAFLMSHSNTIARATEGRETPEETAEWLRRGTEPWFTPPVRRPFVFRAVARCLRVGARPAR